MDFLRFVINQISNDGYSGYFLILFVLSCIPLAVHLYKHGLYEYVEVEEDENIENDF